MEYHTLTDPSLIEKEILRRNIRDFKNLENTSLAGKDVTDNIGFGETTQFADDILKGTANIDAITNDPTSKNLFEIFKTSKLELEIEVTKDKMMDRYKKWNECTATSPSGRHFCHFHDLFRLFRYNLEDPGGKTDLEDKRELVIDVHFMMLQITAVKSHVCVW